MSQNIGTLISSTIRPNSSLDPIATAFANEVKGGHHAYESISDRNLIISERREWGMLVTIYNDGTSSNNKTYQLKHGYVNTDIDDNLNWISFSSNGSSESGEWYDSVLSKITTEPSSASIGDRYLAGVGQSDTITGGGWGSYIGGFIAEWISSSTWSYTFPNDGVSVRVDDENNSIYMFEGIYGTYGGTWEKELISQVRYISASSSLGVTYSATSNPPFDSYTREFIFLSIFGTSNSGASTSLNVNSLGDIVIKKPTGVGLVDLSPGDLMNNVIYNLMYDGTYFQVNIPLGITSVGVIGPAEDGDYTDGLFTDFVTTTPIGTAVDRFNEILKSLVPPSSPVLSDWDGSKSGTVSSGKLSFDGSNPISGFTYISATNSPTIPISVDGTWTASGKRIGIAASASGDITGILNYQVPAHTGVPTPAYIADSFGDANVGSLEMYINGTLKSSATIGLTNISLQNSTSGNTLSGLIVSAATSSKYTSGDTFESFYNRTGTWLLKGNDPLIVYGYNYVQVVHSNSPTFSRTLDRHEFIIDGDTTATSITAGTISSFTFSGSKYLSGIRYFTSGSIRYDVTIDNLYRNTYYAGSDAITFIDNSSGDTSPILNVSTTLALAPCLGTESKQFKISNTDQNGSALTFSAISSGKRRFFNQLSIGVTASRTIQGSTSGGLSSITSVCLDNVATSSTSTFESFDDEGYRLVNTYGGFIYDYVSNISSNPWNSQQFLIGTISGYNDGLQIGGGKLIYPIINFDSGTSSSNPNYGNTYSNYSTAIGERRYIRYFRQASPTTGNFTMIINGTTGSFVPLTTSLTSNNIHVEIKAPGTASAETGWLDAYEDFATGMWSDGDGSRNSSGGVGRAFGVTWGLTIGTKNTANTDGYMLLRITTGSTFSGSIDNITWVFV